MKKTLPIVMATVLCGACAHAGDDDNNDQQRPTRPVNALTQEEIAAQNMQAFGMAMKRRFENSCDKLMKRPGQK